MSITQRLQHLEDKLGEKVSWMTEFQLEDGSIFKTEYDPITYLIKYGVNTPKGRIVHYEPAYDLSKYDPLGLSLLGYIKSKIDSQAQGICHDE